ncbi:MAG: hypothetical protein K2Y39_16015 [Candidatus Obscuribacterales bacterium]|nr:hypothetical protein [Candidatus Obscuribacterales bacterium]
MEKLAKQFGSKLAELVNASPTLSRDVRALRKAGVRIRRLNGVCRAYSRSEPGRPQGALLCIGAGCSPMMQAHYLAHEAYHILVGKTRLVFDPRRISRRRFIGAALREEARCILHEARVSKELHDAGYPIGSPNYSYLVDYLSGGYREVRRRLEHEFPSGEVIPYPEYYGQMYDRRVQEIAQRRRAQRKGA